MPFISGRMIMAAGAGGGSTPMFQRKISGVWTDVEDGEVLTTYRNCGDVMSDSGKAYFGRSVTSSEKSAIETMAGQTLPSLSTSGSNVFIAIAEITSTGFASVSGMTNVTCYISSGFNCNEYNTCDFNILRMFQSTSYACFQFAYPERVGAGNTAQVAVNGLLENTSGNLLQFPDMGSSGNLTSCATDDTGGHRSFDYGIMWGNNPSAADTASKIASTGGVEHYKILI
jgi:hypothetical protein